MFRIGRLHMSPTFLPTSCRMKRPPTFQLYHFFLLLRNFGKYHGKFIGMEPFFWMVDTVFPCMLIVVCSCVSVQQAPTMNPEPWKFDVSWMHDALEQILWGMSTACWTSTHACAMQQMLSRQLLMLMFKKFLKFAHMTDTKQHSCVSMTACLWLIAK